MSHAKKHVSTNEKKTQHADNKQNNKNNVDKRKKSILHITQQNTFSTHVPAYDITTHIHMEKKRTCIRKQINTWMEININPYRKTHNMRKTNNAPYI